MGSPKEVKWGIMATGGIARTFVKDLLVDPTSRGTVDVRHVVVAVASSSSKSSAERFVDSLVRDKQGSVACTAYGSYEELVRDSNVDLIYVATPHSHHYQNCMLALEHGKPVLCEKALTVNAEQAKILYETAKKKNLFFMEAVWTRYFPLSIQVRRWIQEGVIGDVLRVHADNSIGKVPEEEWDLSNRMVNKDLAGGALLDLGIYSLTWVFQTVYHTVQPSTKRQAPKLVGAAMELFPATKADESTTILLEFPHSPPSGQHSTHAIATTSLRSNFDTAHNNDGHQVPAVRVHGEKGEIQVYGPIFRPTHVKLITKANYKDEKASVVDESFDIPGGHGMFWEADEAARCWAAGRLESSGMPWEESILIMQIMDQVRQQGGLTYPSVIESTKYPVDLSGRQT